MDISNKSILVIGLGLSGISTVKTLSKMKAKVYCTDDKDETQLLNVFKELDGFEYNFIKNYKDYNFDFIVKSPGISPSNKMINHFIENNISVYTDLELVTILFENKVISITGTNGKTTTTTLVGEIFKNANIDSKVVGNIGIGMLWEMYNSNRDTVFIIETSSFQLHSTDCFKPFIASIGNITPDHIDWHLSYENYIEDKLKIYKNMDHSGTVILNYDDEILRNLKIKNTNINYISIKDETEDFYLREDKFYFKEEYLFSMKDLKILGYHNAQNVLVAMSICYSYGIDIEIIKKVCLEFKGVEHRIEFVRNLRGINFYNDSKGTNIDSTIKAIEAVNSPIILILGGYDKNVDLNPLFEAFNDKVKSIVLLGETKYKFYFTAITNGFKNINLVSNYNEAIERISQIAIKGDNVLLSPASASWDMFKSYEERGNYFKSLVNELN